MTKKKILCTIISVLLLGTSICSVFAADTTANLGTATEPAAVGYMERISAPANFDFEIISTGRDSVVAEFTAAGRITNPPYVGETGTKNTAEKVSSLQYVLEYDKEYSFVYSVTEDDIETVYNSFLTVERGSNIKVVFNDIIKNEISDEFTRTAGTKTEIESNNNYSSATRTYDDYDNHGALTTNTDVDWWVVSFLNSGTANFWLGNIPTNCDYELELYASNGTTLLMSSENSGNTQELITCPVEARVNYYVKIYSYSGSSTSQYLFRTKNYQNVSIQIIEGDIEIPQSTSSVSCEIPETIANACYDYNSSFAPYSGWPAIDYDNTTGKAGTGSDRVLRQLEITVIVTQNSTPVSGLNITLSTSLGANAYIHKLSNTTNSSGTLKAYIEYYGTPNITIYADYQGTTATKVIQTNEALYKNSFMMTIYNFALRSNFNSWAEFEEAVQMNGTGYDDINDQWYSFNYYGNILPINGPNNTASGTTPTEYRTIAVDKAYITREYYSSNGTSAWHRGYVYIEGMDNASGDNGYRYAEDSGGAINGYHIDLFVGYKSIADVYSLYGSYVVIDSGYYFPKITYVLTNKGSVN